MEEINKLAPPIEEPPLLELVHEAGDAFVTILQEKNYIEEKWKGHITAGNVIEAARLSIPLFEATHCPGLMSDKTDVSGDWQDANDWLEYEWIPLVIKAGLKYFAYVHSKSMLSLYSALDLKKRMPPELQMSFFHSHVDAKDWLNQKAALNMHSQEPNR